MNAILWVGNYSGKEWLFIKVEHIIIEFSCAEPKHPKLGTCKALCCIISILLSQVVATLTSTSFKPLLFPPSQVSLAVSSAMGNVTILHVDTLSSYSA